MDSPQHRRDLEHASGGQQGRPVADTMLYATSLFFLLPAVALPGPPGPPGQPGLPGSRNLVSILGSHHSTLGRFTSDSVRLQCFGGMEGAGDGLEYLLFWS